MIVLEEYDFTFVFTTARKCGVFLSLVKALANRYRVCVYISKLSESDLGKTIETNEQFISLIREYNAEVIEGGGCKTNFLIIPQWHFSKEEAHRIFSDVMSKKVYWMVSLAMGNYSYENLYGHHVDALLVVDEQFYRYRLAKRPDERELANGIKVYEVGVPFVKYPVFESLNIDYLLANPTGFSFPNKIDRLSYLDNVIKIIEKTSPGDVIAYKPHNAMESVDSIVSKRLIEFIENRVPDFMEKILFSISEVLSHLARGRIDSFVTEVRIASRYRKIMKSVTPLNTLTPYGQFNLEMFLPQVKKGLITGRSNSMWHALYNRLPVYNCVPDETGKISSDKMHAANMEYFGVRCCNGNVDFLQDQFEVVSERTRNADFVAFLVKQYDEVISE